MNSLEETRASIDQIDDAVVELLCQRQQLVEAAGTFKRDDASVRAPERVAEVLTRIRSIADDHGGDPDLMEEIYRGLIDTFIRHEAATKGRQ